MNQESPKITPTSSKRPLWLKLLKGIGRLFVLLLLLFFGLTFLIQTKPVQNWLVNKTTTYLSKELGTPVSVGQLYIDFFDKLVLKSFYVEDFHGDTLIYSKALTLNFNTDLRRLLHKHLSISDLTLENTQFRMYRYPREQDDQFKQLLSRMSRNEQDSLTSLSKEPDKPFFLDVDVVHLINAAFIKQDSVGGEDIKVFLQSGDIRIALLDIANKLIRIDEATLIAPNVSLINYLQKPLLVDSIREESIGEEESDTNGIKWRVLTSNLNLVDGYFEHHNYRNAPIKLTTDKEIDYNHLKVGDIQIQLADFEINDWVFTAESKKFSLKENSGFILNNLSVKRGSIAPTRVELQGMELVTPYSHLKDSLVFTFNEYPDFKDFPNKVWMEGHFIKAYISLQDIMHLAPKLRKKAFFAQNSKEILYIDGLIRGKINSLKGRKLNLKLGNLVRLKGGFNTRDITKSDEAYLDMTLDRLETSMKTLHLLVPSMNLPKNFDKLGNLNFSGTYTGFYEDFVANGHLKSDLGEARMNLRLDLKKGLEGATYKGNLELNNFDLAKWSGDNNFGLVTFKSEVENGEGLTLETAKATLHSSIDKFSFKNYEYENLNIKGELAKSGFKGGFSIKDDNIDFIFDGTVSFEEKLPEFKFKANVNRLDMKALKLMKEDFILSGDIDLKLRGSSLDDLQGFATLYDVNILRYENTPNLEKEKYFIDSLKASSAIQSNRNKVWRFDSEMGQAALIGDFNVAKIGEAVLQFIEKNYVGISERFNIHSKRGSSFDNNQFSLALNILDTKNFTGLLDKKLDTIRNTELRVHFDYAQDSFEIALDLPAFKYDKVVLNGVTLSASGYGKQSGLNLAVEGTNINDKFRLAPVKLLSHIINDSITFNLNTKDFEEATDRLNLYGSCTLAGDLFNFKFSPFNLVILNEEWTIDENNYLQIGRKFIKTHEFELFNGVRRVALKSLEGDRGVNLDVDGFNMHYINEIWSYKNLQFEGIYQIEATVGDVFKMEDLQLTAVVDTFLINEDPFGKLVIDGSAKNIKSPVDLNISSKRGEQELRVAAVYNPPTMPVIVSELSKDQRNYLTADVSFYKFPLNIAEYFITNGITNTVGDFEASLAFEGLLPKPSMKGTLHIFNGATSLDYTGTRYSMSDGIIKMSDEYLFDITGVEIKDELNNTATITGGITHDFFKNLGLNARVKSDHFQVINTTKADNEVYYGSGIGQGDIYFSGNFDQTNIDIVATTSKGTRVYIPVESSNTVKEKSFIRFVSKKDTIDTVSSIELNKKTEIKGIKLHIELAMNDEAEVQLIFDEKAGDIMKGSGFGNIKMDMTRQGNISMYGHYEIEKGEYLFTLFNLVNKPFTVKRGGTIDWTGDPYNALINIDAEYRGLYATPYNFISEYLNDDNIKTEAKKSTSIGLSMKITGQLLKPDIAFDLSFPSLTGEIKNYADNKIREIRLDPNELNRQVFGLIVIGSFLPTNQGILQGRELLTGINTLSELLSNQLSLYLTDFFSSAVSSNFLSLEDFDVAYTVYDASYLDDPNRIKAGHEVHVRNRVRIKDRWVVNTAMGVDLGGSYLSSDEALVAGDVIVEYELTKDRRLKIRGYYKNQPELFGGRKNNAGLGLSFRREFDSLDLLSFLKKSSKTMLQASRTGEPGLPQNKNKLPK